VRQSRLEYIGGASEEAFAAVFAGAPAGGGFLAILPEREKDAVPLLQRAARAAGVPVVGGIFPALVRDDEFVSSGAWLVRFDEMPRAWLFGRVPADPAENAAFVAAAAEEFNGHLDALGADGDATLLMFFDALVPNVGTTLDGLYARMADRVNYLGANPGSESFQPMPCLFDGDRVVGGGLLALVLPGHGGGVVEHGYGMPEKIIHATAASGNCIATIDWRPAFDVYREFVLGEYGVEITKDNFFENSVHFPFGIVRANGGVLVRIPVVLSPDGSLFCIGEVPASSVMTLLKASEASSADTVEAVHRGLTAIGTGGSGGSGGDALLFFCAGRHIHLGDAGAAAELSRFRSRTGAGRVAGARSLGEIGPSALEGGLPFFHNAALVAMAL
jgi:hypothetical protein